MAYLLRAKETYCMDSGPVLLQMKLPSDAGNHKLL